MYCLAGGRLALVLGLFDRWNRAAALDREAADCSSHHSDSAAEVTA